MLKLISLMF